MAAKAAPPGGSPAVACRVAPEALAGATRVGRAPRAVWEAEAAPPVASQVQLEERRPGAQARQAAAPAERRLPEAAAEGMGAGEWQREREEAVKQLEGSGPAARPPHSS